MRTEGGGQPRGQRRVAAVARAARRIGARPTRRGRPARASAEKASGSSVVPMGRGPVAERERAHDQREEDRDEGCAVDPRVEHANSAG